MQEIFPETRERLERWKLDDDVLGVLLVGSKSRGHGDRRSDDDLEVLLTDRAFARFTPAACCELLQVGEGADRRLIYDAQITSLADIERKADSPLDLDRWPYEKAGILFDRTGAVTAAVKRAGRMDEEFRRLRLLHATVDTWVAPYRAKKTRDRGFEGAARLLVAQGVQALARIVFALEHRWVPLYHWLEAELATLEDRAGCTPLLIDALVHARAEAIEEALAKLEDPLHEAGVPRPAGRHDLFFELIHPARAAERAIHGL
jgi:hypothetical protein